MALTGLALVACQSLNPATLTETDRAMIETSLDDYVNATLAGDWAAVAASYTEDAIVMPENSPIIEGRTNIQAYYEESPPISEMTANNVEVVGMGDIAYVRGTYTLTIAVEGAEPITDTGKFLEIRRKQADGAWLLHRDMFSSDIAAE